MPRYELGSYVVSVALALVLLHVLDRRRGLAAAAPAPLSRVEWALYGSVFAAAVALRVWRLTDLPAVLHNDEMSCGLAARAFLSKSPPSLFDTGWFYTPQLSFFPASLTMRLFGDGLLGLRMSSALLGSAGLLGGAWLARQLFGRTAGVLTLILTATDHWHLHLSRTGFTYVQAAALAVLTLATFRAATASGRLRTFGLAGLLTGIGLQAYWGYRIVPVGLALWGLFLICSRPSARRELLAGALALVAVAGLVLSPLLAFYSVVPEWANERTREIVIFGDESIEHVLGVVRRHTGSDTPGAVVWYQLQRAFGFFAVGRDSSRQYGFRGPFVPAVLWVPFAAGLVLAARSRDGPGGFVLVALTVLAVLVGAALTVDPPFSPRLSAIAGLLPVFSALALARLWDAGHGRLRLAARAATALVVTAAAALGVRAAFVVHPAAEPGSRRDEIVRLLARHPDVGAVVNHTGIPENFDYESYAFMAPGVPGINTDCDPGRLTAALRAAREMRAAVLLVSLPADPDVERVRADRPAAAEGRFPDRRGGASAWCLLR